MKICVLGGTGFVGRALIMRLVAAGHHVYVITRRRERHRDLLVLPTLQLIDGDVHNPVVLRLAFQGMDAVVNLAGILNEPGHDGKGFERVHAGLPGKVVEACQSTGVKRLLHMSSLNASLDAPSHYLRSKARGENIVHHAAGGGLAVTSFRPSVIFGAHDAFTNRFARLLRLTPFIFPLACARARLQPVYINDVVEAFVSALNNHQTFGQRFNLCGPRIYTLYELIIYIAELIAVKRKILPLNDRLSFLQAAVLEFFPGKPFSLDNYRSLQRDSVCDAEFPQLFNIHPVSLETIAPTYLQPLPHYRAEAKRT